MGCGERLDRETSVRATEKTRQEMTRALWPRLTHLDCSFQPPLRGGVAMWSMSRSDGLSRKICPSNLLSTSSMPLSWQ